MLKNLIVGALFLLLFACNNQPAPPNTNKTSPTATPASENKYPEELQKVFTKHGGLATWQKMHALSYEIVSEEDGNEAQFIDLKNRREKIEAPTFVTGYDGQQFWLEADTSIYKGHPVFYHNLMFYFYAMPFVLADDGIIYEEATPLEFEGKSYPGYSISYKDGVGISSKDEYFIHYDKDTYEMSWLGYTVTYFSNEKSKKIKWIRYNDWALFNGLLLPNSMSWYKLKDGKPVEPRGNTAFAKVLIQEAPFEDITFAKTPKAVFLPSQ